MLFPSIVIHFSETRNSSELLEEEVFLSLYSKKGNDENLEDQNKLFKKTAFFMHLKLWRALT